MVHRVNLPMAVWPGRRTTVGFLQCGGRPKAAPFVGGVFTTVYFNRFSKDLSKFLKYVVNTVIFVTNAYSCSSATVIGPACRILVF